MKATALIQAVLECVAEHGDLEVLVESESVLQNIGSVDIEDVRRQDEIIVLYTD